MIRSVVEKIVRNRHFRRRLPNGVQIFVTPDSQLKYLKRKFDADLTSFAHEHVNASSSIWDIGANCGVFAFSGSAARQVVAVEADPFLADLIRRSSVMNSVPVAVVTAAAYSSQGLAEFIIAARGRASNHLAGTGNSQTGGERSRIVVPTLTLDTLLDHFGKPTVVKIDVEGAETAVLAGATRLLKEARPLLYIEVAPETEAPCRAALTAAGYRLSRAAEMNWLAEPL